ncbi:MAG TPA: ABC transporter permease, partial [Blastocatellia bacterium]
MRVFIHRLRGLFLKRKLEQDLEDEIRSHLEMQIEDNQRQGMTPEEARRAASRKFGGVVQVKEAYRDRLSLPAVETAFQDLRYGLRMLRRNPGFTFVAVLTLALGIGANTAIFSVVNAVLLRPLPYRDPDRLVMVGHHGGSQGTVTIRATPPDFLEWREQAKVFEQIAAYKSSTADITVNGEPERLDAGIISANLFATLGVAPALGRAFTPEEDTADGPPAVILSDSLWRRRFGGDPHVIGRTLKVGAQSHTVVGIMPPEFKVLEEPDLWLPLALNVTKELSRQGGTFVISMFARLKPGVTLEAARADLSVILERNRQAFPRLYLGLQVGVIGLSESLIGDVRPALLVMFGAVTFVLLIACANVANLLLARSAARQKEMAIRAAIGAGRLRLMRQMLTESLLLSLAGGVVGLLAAKWGVKLLVAMSPDGIARIEESGVDIRVFGFTCAVAALTGLIAGVFPSLQASKTNVNQTLKAQSTAGAVWSRPSGVRKGLPALMIVELALALVLLVGSGLMVKSFLRLLAVPKGFNPDGVLTLALRPSLAKYPRDSPRRLAYFQESLARVQALPGVRSASLTSFLPLGGPHIRMFLQIDGRPPFEIGKEPIIEANHISPDHFQTMGMQLRAGRQFTAQDAGETQKVVIINEMLARRFFPNENPIGRRLLMGQTPQTIVGVVSDVYHLGLDQEVHAEVYFPYLQMPNFVLMNLAVRAASDQRPTADQSNSAALAASIRNQMRSIDPNEPINQAITMDERLSKSVAGRRFQMLLIGLFAVGGLLIAMVGIYGVISYAVSQRAHEIGIRMALGAQAGDVLKMVVRWAMSLALIGVALGVTAALALTRVMKNLLFEVSATDPVTFALIALLLLSVAFIASYIPARRATRVDPLIALRSE